MGIEVRVSEGGWRQVTADEARSLVAEMFNSMPAMPIGFKLEYIQEHIRGMSIRELMQSAPERMGAIE